MTQAWVGVDLDGTLAVYDGWKGADVIGKPIRPIQEWVLELLRYNVDVRIFTARCQEGDIAIKAIEEWCDEHLGAKLPVTDKKDMNMVMMVDDRAWNPWSTARDVAVLPQIPTVVSECSDHWNTPSAPPKELSR